MTEWSPGGLIEGTITDLATLMGNPPGLRRGYTFLNKPANPAAGAGFTYKVDSAWWERLVAVSFTLATSAQTPLRSLALNLADNDGYVFNQTQIANAIPANQVISEFGDQNSTSVVQGGTGPSAEGSVTSPGAAAAIATLSGLAAGTYSVTAVVNLAGTLAQATDANNLKLYNGGLTLYEALDNNIGATAQTFGPFLIEVPANGSIVLATVVAGSVGSIYSGLLAATPSPQQAGFTFPNMILKSGWQASIAVGGIQTNDQLSAIGIMTERYPSNWADGSLGMDIEAALAQLGG